MGKSPKKHHERIQKMRSPPKPWRADNGWTSEMAFASIPLETGLWWLALAQYDAECAAINGGPK